jgi:thiol-disulfide isomerase/thioredoxin
MRRLFLAIGGLGLIAVVAIGLAQSAGNNKKPKAKHVSVADIRRELAGSPAPLASLHTQSNALLGGGKQALDARLKELRGYPVVLNKWASWCGPCRAEFPVLQSTSLKLGKRVAFLGLNSNDNRGNAASFLSDFRVPYPSYEDPHERIAQSVGAPANYPITVFFDSAGKRTYVHQGPYRDEGKFVADIQRYAQAG